MASEALYDLSSLVSISRNKTVLRLPTLWEKLPKAPRSIYLSATGWKQLRGRSRGKASPSPPSFTTHAREKTDAAATPLAQMGPSLCSVPSVRSGGPGSGWASRTVLVPRPLALEPILEVKGPRTSNNMMP
ncbi:hypothetical protein E4U42_003725 [Claviceps africana]|uniref:Uncharacterized protein n=1 Tax=Claviceps africana TaxID=83212 RepID=A0A8K0J652_9HYPO|nr:hypothetical protein E4U42_003725 [Claviceps africana]